MFIGIDIGSRSIELVAIEQGQPRRMSRLSTTFDPLSQCRRLLEEVRTNGAAPKAIVATGYGRRLVEKLEISLPVECITEIKAHALGVNADFSEARTVLDIGGQDTKAIALRPDGRVLKFEMNDRCAAGTGKFLEYTAGVFQLPVEEFGQFALQGTNPPVINSMCTVFAETEATSLMAGGTPAADIALALHKAIVKRTANMLGRVGLQLPLAFVGGVARNACVRELLAAELGVTPGRNLLIPETPDMTGALGAALWGQQQAAEE